MVEDRLVLLRSSCVDLGEEGEDKEIVRRCRGAIVAS